MFQVHTGQPQSAYFKGNGLFTNTPANATEAFVEHHTNPDNFSKGRSISLITGGAKSEEALVLEGLRKRGRPVVGHVDPARDPAHKDSTEVKKSMAAVDFIRLPVKGKFASKGFTAAANTSHKSAARLRAVYIKLAQKMAAEARASNRDSTTVAKALGFTEKEFSRLTTAGTNLDALPGLITGAEIKDETKTRKKAKISDEDAEAFLVMAMRGGLFDFNKDSLEDILRHHEPDVSNGQGAAKGLALSAPRPGFKVQKKNGSEVDEAANTLFDAGAGLKALDHFEAKCTETMDGMEHLNDMETDDGSAEQLLAASMNKLGKKLRVVVQMLPRIPKLPLLVHKYRACVGLQKAAAEEEAPSANLQEVLQGMVQALTAGEWIEEDAMGGPMNAVEQAREAWRAADYKGQNAKDFATKLHNLKVKLTSAIAVCDSDEASAVEVAAAKVAGTTAAKELLALDMGGFQQWVNDQMRASYTAAVATLLDLLQ